MRILAVNSSPRGKNGNTELLLQAFLRGARSAGAEAEVVYLKEKKINPCLGCYTCWFKTPGTCVHQDDMPELLDKRRHADVLIYATPLYVYTVSGMMKDFMDRALPLAMPHIVKYGDRYGHPRRYSDNNKVTKVVLVSSCGFPDRQYFTGMQETFRILCSGPFSELAGSILCSGGALLGVPQARPQIQWYLDACEAAGREVVEQGLISPATNAVLEREIADIESYVKQANDMFDRVLGGAKPV